MSYTKSLSQLSSQDVFTAWGKWASLGEMIQSWIPVPWGFVVLSTTFDYFIEKTWLDVQIQGILDGVNHKTISSVEEASENIHSLIMSFPMPEEIEREIYISYDVEKLEYVAVRSSATAEDGAEHAWAGQLDSYLNTTREDLIQKVRKCWASLFTTRAIFYRFEKDLHNDHISVAVVVQKMVQSEMSGIAFSVHPVTQDRNQMIIEAWYGLGEAIVSGSITPDSYVVRKDNNEIDITVNYQQKALYRAEAWGNKWVQLNDKGKDQILMKEQIQELAKIILIIENHYGFPCDIEWAYEDRVFYIVQSRPITTLGEKVEKKIELGKAKPTEYKFFYESQWYTLLLEDLIFDAYIQRPTKVIALGNHVRKYVPAATIENLYATWLLHTKEIIEQKVITIKHYISKIKQYDIQDENNIVHILNDFKQILSLYSYFDTAYTEGIYKNNPSDERAVLIDASKNVLRDNFDYLFFREDGILYAILNLLEKKWISFQDSTYYKYDEIIELVNNNIQVSKEEIEKRKTAYIYDRDEYGKIIFISWEEVVEENTEFLKWFEIDKAQQKIKWTVAHKNQSIITWKVCTIHRDYSNLKKLYQDMEAMQHGDILVTTITDPEFMPAIKKAWAIITDIWWLLSHSAISAREFDVSCIVGTEIATQVLKDGDLIEVDADNGVVRILS